jgi:predicted nucleic acid-binding protein
MRGRNLPEYFADSYAFVAFLEGNGRYVRIFKRKALCTSALNILELYGTLLRRFDPAEARASSVPFLPLVVSGAADVALAAGEFRHRMRARRRDCSYIDAWGYAMAQEIGVPFLTGDPSFKAVENVEFVR